METALTTMEKEYNLGDQDYWLPSSCFKDKICTSCHKHGTLQRYERQIIRSSHSNFVTLLLVLWKIPKSNYK